MDAKALKEITSELTVLYVEDDTDLRVETAKLFTHLFKSTDTAENGKVALEMTKEKKYDLIVTDINMPIMDGVTLSKELKEIDPTQTIIITSAHDESSYLLDLIDIGIDKFILKPLDMQKFLSALTSVCSNILNEKLIIKYKKEIEASNLHLTKANEELETMVKILDNKIVQMNSNNKIIQKIPQQSPKDAINKISTQPPLPQKKLVRNTQDLYTYDTYIKKNDLEHLEKLEIEIESISSLFNLQENITQESVSTLSNALNKHGEILSNYPLFHVMSHEIKTLAKAISDNSEIFTQVSHDVGILLESFIYVLKKWRISLFSKGVKDPNIYDLSMINDIKTIIIILQGNEDESINDLEFF